MCEQEWTGRANIQQAMCASRFKLGPAFPPAKNCTCVPFSRCSKNRNRPLFPLCWSVHPAIAVNFLPAGNSLLARLMSVKDLGRYFWPCESVRGRPSPPELKPERPAVPDIQPVLYGCSPGLRQIIIQPARVGAFAAIPLPVLACAHEIPIRNTDFRNFFQEPSLSTYSAPSHHFFCPSVRHIFPAGVEESGPRATSSWEKRGKMELGGVPAGTVLSPRKPRTIRHKSIATNSAVF